MAKRTKRLTEQGNEKDEIRINKFLSEAGVCSRREADRYIMEGKVKIDGIVAQMGSKVTKENQVIFCDKPVKKEEKLVLIAFNKPEGIVCTTDQKDPDNIIDYIDYGMRIYPIGRLDKDSEGLILLTNDGNIVNKILRAENNHEKEYIVTVNKEITLEFIKALTSGVPILDTVTKPCVVNQIDKNVFSIILTQGLNRQIRRMCEYLGYRVIKLKRIRIMNIQLGRLKTGDFRNVTEKEIEELNSSFQQLKSHIEPRHRKESISADEKNKSDADSGSNRVKSDRKAGFKVKRSTEKSYKGKNNSIKNNTVKNSIEKSITEKIGAEKRGAKRISSEKIGAEKRGAKRISSEKTNTEKIGAEKRGAKKFSTEKTGSEKRGAKKIGTEKIGSEKPGAKKIGTEKIGSERSSAERNKTDKNYSEKNHSGRRDHVKGNRYHK